MTAFDMRISALCAALLGLSLTAPALGGSFSIAPIRAELSHAQRTCALTLHNEADAPVVVQVSTVAWSQVNGEDHYEPTHDLIATPPVFQLAPKANQIVRIALRRDADADREQQYRVYFEEVPQALPKDFNGLQIALRIGVPAFVAPLTKASPQLAWKGRWTQDGEFVLAADNAGKAHVQLIDFDVAFGGAAAASHVAASKYLLPANGTQWTIKAPAGASHDAAPHVRGFSDAGDIDAPVTLTNP